MGLGWLEIGGFVGEIVGLDTDGGALLDGDKVGFSSVALGDEVCG